MAVSPVCLNSAPEWLTSWQGGWGDSDSRGSVFLSHLESRLSGAGPRGHFPVSFHQGMYRAGLCWLSFTRAIFFSVSHVASARVHQMGEMERLWALGSDECFES